jgi:hypothetical protein
VLDRAANGLDHVAWCDVTARGYTILEIGPDEIRSEWWFVQPYVEDPSSEAELAAAFVTERATWPPTLDRREDASADPSRPGLLAALPDRPPDLATIRHRRTARVSAESAGLTTAVSVAIGAAAFGLRHVLRGRLRKR